jgi:hypothetical protein
VKLVVGVFVALAACKGEHEPAPAPAPAAHPPDAAPPMRVQVTADEVTIRGAHIADVHGGEIDDRDTTPNGDSQPELLRLRNTIEATARPTERITIELDPALHYGALVLVLYTLTRAHYNHVALVSPAGAAPVDLDMRDPPPPTDAGAPTIRSMRMIVGLYADGLVVYSTTGDEGTPAAPKLVEARGAGGYDLAALQKTLRDVVDTRWGKAPRNDDELRIIVGALADMRVGDVIAIVRATRADASGVLFPDTQLTGAW